MEIRVLGELTVLQDGRSAPVTAPMQRKLLALMVANLGRPVSVDRILETLYGEDLPGSPERALRFHVSKLRSTLEPDAPATQRTGLIRTVTNGYQLEVDPSVIDAHRFAALADEARELLPTDPEASTAAASRALELWRGEPLADYEYEDFAQPLRIELTERKLSLDEAHIEALLALGDNEQAIALIRPLTKQHPYRESLYSLLMTALYRSGRQVDALAVYQEARETLLEDLGIDPGPELSELEHQILTQAPGLIPMAPPAVGHNLPPAVPLVGRDDAARELGRLIDTNRLVQITGLPGVGKSALAVSQAHDVRADFTAGVLYATVEEGMPARHLIERLAKGLVAIGGPLVDDGNATRTIADHDTLVVIDDAHESPDAAVEVANRLLADGQQASIIVTTRVMLDAMPGEAATLDPLDPPTDGVRLLAELLDTSEPGEAESHLATIATATGGIPRAIETAAAAVRIASAGGESADDIEMAILHSTTEEIADQALGSLPESAMQVARGLALFPEGLPLDAILDTVAPNAEPVSVLRHVATLAASGVIVEDHAGYRTARVLDAHLKEPLGAPARRDVLLRAAARCGRDRPGLVPANAADVVRQLAALEEREAALDLVAARGPSWWQDPHRAAFAELCRLVLDEPDLPVGHSLETVLFFAALAFLDLGDEQTAMNYWSRYSGIAASLDDPSVEMHALQLRGNIDAYTGALADARLAYADAVTLGRGIGHPEVTWIAASRVTIDVLLGDVDRAERGADEVAAEATIRQQLRGQAFAAELRGSAAFLRGDLDDALAEFAGARDIAVSCGAVWEEVASLQRIVETQTCLGEIDTAQDTLREAERLISAVGLVEPPPLIAAAAVVAAERRDPEAATRLLADLRGALQYRRPAAWVHRALVAAALAASADGRISDAGARVAAADDLGQRTGIRLPAPWASRIAEIRDTAGPSESSADPLDLVS